MGFIKTGKGVIRTHGKVASRTRPKTFDYKSLSLEELKELFQGVDIFGPKEPRKHQYASIAFAAEKDRVGLIHDIGTGKTLTAIWTSLIWEVKNTLVIGPSDSFTAWERDLGSNDLDYTVLTGKAEDRKKLLQENYKYNVINYEGLKVLFAKILYSCPYCGQRFSDKEEVYLHYPNCKKYQNAIYKEHEVKGQWVIDYNLITDKFDCIILDEAHRTYDNESLQGKIAYELCWRAKKVIWFTGSLCNKKTEDEDLLHLWHLMRIIDNGATLGNNFFKYRKRYFYEAGFKWKLKTGAKEKILDAISSSCIRYEKEDCIDLPEVTYEVLSVDPSKEQIRTEKDIIEQYDSNPLLLDQKLRQVASGFLYETGETGRRSTIKFPCNKITEIKYVLEELPSEKIIIFFVYIEEGRAIQEFLTKENIHFTTIIGSDSIPQRDENFKKFVQNKKIQVLMAQCRCASESREIIVAHSVIFFSQTDYKTRSQCEGRIIREGQKRRCLIIDIISRGTIEEKIIKNRGSQKSSSDIVLEYIKEKGGKG